MYYIITWDIGYGETEEVVEADNLEEAKELAYKAALADFNSSVYYDAEILQEEEDFDEE